MIKLNKLNEMMNKPVKLIITEKFERSSDIY